MVSSRFDTFWDYLFHVPVMEEGPFEGRNYILSPFSIVERPSLGSNKHFFQEQYLPPNWEMVW